MIEEITVVANVVHGRTLLVASRVLEITLGKYGGSVYPRAQFIKSTHLCRHYFEYILNGFFINFPMCLRNLTLGFIFGCYVTTCCSINCRWGGCSTILDSVLITMVFTQHLLFPDPQARAGECSVVALHFGSLNGILEHGETMKGDSAMRLARGILLILLTFQVRLK